MQPIVAVIAPGMMGSAVGQRLVENGIEVRTLLTGRSDATRGARQGRRHGRTRRTTRSPRADIILSILPPGDALGLAERLAPALRAARRSRSMSTATRSIPATAAADRRASSGRPAPHSSMAASSAAHRGPGYTPKIICPGRGGAARG